MQGCSGPPPDLYATEGNILRNNSASGMATLARVLRGPLGLADFKVANIQPAVLQAFSTAQALAGFPLVIGEFQFFANSAALRGHGVANPATASWEDIEAAVTRAAGGPTATAAAPLIVGEGWARTNVWAAFVSAWGGRPLGSDGLPDLVGTAPQTARLVGLARRAKWSPTTTYRAGTPERDFVIRGFAGAASAALFALSVPWNTGATVDVAIGKREVRVEPVVSLCAGAGMCRLAPLPYPAGPSASPAPAVGVAGLVLHPRAAHPDHAVTFAAWLYERPQQEMLAALGYPPVITDAAAQAPLGRSGARRGGRRSAV